MIFVDTNVFMYAVGRDHPLKAQAREVFEQAVVEPGKPLVTSAEVLQELLHAYLPVNRMQTLDDALELVARGVQEVWPIEGDDVLEAVHMATSYPALGARELLHLACCRRRSIGDIRTFDRGLNAAFATY